MDRLTEQQRTAIGKMSDERLRVRLVQAGLQEEVVGQLDRPTMMLTLDKYIADEEERTFAAVEVQERAEDENLDDSTDTQTQNVFGGEAFIFGRETFSDGRTALESRTGF